MAKYSGVGGVAAQDGLQPNFFIIGAARSGTTMLAEMLRQHPSIFITQPKEPHYLAFAHTHVSFSGPGDDVTINRVSVTDDDAYRSLYDSAGGKSIRGDASVSTLYFAEQSLTNLKRSFPAAQLVVVLREPIARAFSAYSYLRVRGFEPCEDFLEAVEREPERAQGNWHYLWHYMEMGRYARQLRPFLEEWGPDRVRILFYEDMKREPGRAAQEVFRFLQLDDSAQVVVRHVNGSGVPRSQLLQRTMHRAARDAHLRDVVKWAVPFRVRERIRRANLQTTDAPRDAVRVLEPAFREELVELKSLLKEYYPKTMESLPAWLKRDAELLAP